MHTEADGYLLEIDEVGASRVHAAKKGFRVRVNAMIPTLTKHGDTSKCTLSLMLISFE